MDIFTGFFLGHLSGDDLKCALQQQCNKDVSQSVVAAIEFNSEDDKSLKSCK